MPGSPPAVVVDGVTKRFRLPHERVHTLKERALHPLRKSGFDALQALDDVSFAVEPGEFFGIVGRNGSGKSTLLKCMAGIYATDAGRIYVNGRLATFIELGVGFNNDLPARDNVMINATMLGLTPREARRRYDAIIDFAELREFEDLKLKNYSSGMEVRLAFSTMMQVDGEILLIDEVLAVGDANFQQKCFDEFARIRREGRTVLLVTHDMGNVQRFCDRAVLLERGSVVELGDPSLVSNRYLEVNFDQGGEEDHAREEGRYGDGRAEITDAWFEDASGARVTVLPSRRSCAVCFSVRFTEEIADPLFGLVLNDDRGNPVFEASNVFDGDSGTYPAGESTQVRVRFDCLLSSGRYDLTPAVARGGGGVAWIDRRERFASIVVTGVRNTDAVLDVPFTMELVAVSALETGHGRQIKGPSAVGEDPRRFWHLTRSLAVTNFKLRFFGSILGYAWQVMRPLLLFGVLYLLFTEVLDVGNETPLYGVALLLGLVLFTFFSEATSGAVTSITDRENLVRKIEFPRLAVPLSVVLTALFNLGLNLLVVFAFLLGSGGRIRVAWLELVPIVVLMVIFASGIAMLLSALYVRARDVRPIWDVVLQVLFYGTPIFYTLETVRAKSHDAWYSKAFMLNPFAALMQQARHAVVDPAYVSSATGIGGTWRLAAPLAITVVVFALGYLVFRRAAPHLAEDL